MMDLEVIALQSSGPMYYVTNYKVA